MTRASITGRRTVLDGLRSIIRLSAPCAGAATLETDHRRFRNDLLHKGNLSQKHKSDVAIACLVDPGSLPFQKVSRVAYRVLSYMGRTASQTQIESLDASHVRLKKQENHFSSKRCQEAENSARVGDHHAADSRTPFPCIGAAGTNGDTRISLPQL